jgi:hypothetical protein
MGIDVGQTAKEGWSESIVREASSPQVIKATAVEFMAQVRGHHDRAKLRKQAVIFCAVCHLRCPVNSSVLEGKHIHEQH